MAGRFDAMAAGIHSHRTGCDVVVREIATGALVRHGHARHARWKQADPDQWWHAMLAAIVDAGGFADVAAFSIAAPAAVVVLDADGAVIRPALTGGTTQTPHRRTPGAEHRRTPDDTAATLIAEVGADTFRARTGGVPTASSPITLLRWLRAHEPAQADRTEAAVLAHDWLTWRLRGFGPGGSHGSRLEELATDRSEASGTGFWDPSRGRWDHELFNTALGHPAIKPRVMRADGWGGETAKRPEQGIRTGRVMGVGAAELAAAMLGWAARDGDAILRADAADPAVTVVTDEAATAAPGITVAADASGRFTATARAARPEAASARHPATPTTEAAVVAAARDALAVLRGAGVTPRRVLLPAASAYLAEAAAALGMPVLVAGSSTPIADGAAAQAAWATSRTLPRWPGVAAS